jgi:tRNA 2-thiocytidine biosynthesis protein TtcA
MSKLGFFISKKVGRAICDFNMLADGDRVAVGVSGGKDSLSLLKILEERRRIVPIKYKVVALHLDMGYGGMPSGILKRHFQANGYEYHIKKINILDTVDGDSKRINCFWCSWNRRKHLFLLAHKYGCRKLALGHHKDDIIHTLLLNMFFQGDVSSMAPRQEMFKGEITIIRPLAYVEEKELARFAKELGLPLASCRCPNAQNNKRILMRQIVNKLEKICPQVKTNLFRSIYPDGRAAKTDRIKAQRKKV